MSVFRTLLSVGLLSLLGGLLAACTPSPVDLPPADGIALDYQETAYKEALPCLSLKLELGPKPRPSQQVPLNLKAKNVCPKQLDWYLGNNPPFDFSITQGGAQVWNFLDGKIVQQPILVKRLGAGKEEAFSATWNLQRNDGEPLAPGTYSVKGIFTNVSLSDENYQRIETLPLRIVIPKPAQK